ncbi:MAG: sigma 54-interacting transcriptional regulator [Acidobacteriota bacterium]
MRTPATHRASSACAVALAEPRDSFSVHQSPRTLLRDLVSRLPRVAEVRTVQVTLYGSGQGSRLLRIFYPPQEEPQQGHSDADSGEAAELTPAHAVWRDQEPMMVTVSDHAALFPGYVSWMRALGLQTEWVTPVTSAERRLGAIGFGLNTHRCDPSELDALASVAKQYAAAWGDVLDLHEAHWTRGELARERDHSRLLLEINNAIASYLDLDELWQKVAECLLSIVPHDYSDITLYDEEHAALRRIATSRATGAIIPEDEFIPLQGTAAGFAFHSGEPLVITPADLHRFPRTAPRRSVAQAGFGSACLLPLISHNRKLGILSLGSSHKGAFRQEQVAILTGVASQVAIAVENALTHREVESLKNRLHAEKQYLDEEIQTSCNFEIIGNSEAFLRILRQVELAGPTDSTILIQGETGSGKEIIARAIHQLSNRRERALVRVNCSAIPTGLLESEFFGHEKGAFTGAIARRAGRFELAHQGTLFLDEVGDIPRELQPKLLRVLQEKEFERVGGTKTIQVDVRIVAATNADLVQMVADKEFRSDLYYRLNVFPITVPPLRERPADIVPLARRFAQNFAQRMKKPIEAIPQPVQAALIQYQWPGNIRELQNVIERAVILSRGSVLEVPLSELTPVARDATLAGTEREYILRVLRETNWVVSGENGAASRLGLNRSTLQSRMRKLGINRPR